MGQLQQHRLPVPFAWGKSLSVPLVAAFLLYLSSFCQVSSAFFPVFNPIRKQPASNILVPSYPLSPTFSRVDPKPQLLLSQQSFVLFSLFSSDERNSTTMTSSSSTTTATAASKDDENMETADSSCSTQMKDAISSTRDTAITLQQQIEQLRADAARLEQEIQSSKEAKLRKQQETTDRWIRELLLVQPSTSKNNNKDHEDTSSTMIVEVLATKEQVAERLQVHRYSAEQVTKMFYRICEKSSPYQSIDKCSPLISLLLDAACIVDCMEREDNPNKRWNHRVERDLRRTLFAMGWGIDMELVHAEERSKQHQSMLEGKQQRNKSK